MDRLEQHFNREKATREDVTCALPTYLLWRLPRAAPWNHRLPMSLCLDVSLLPPLAHSAGQMWLSVSATRVSLYHWKERTGNKHPGSSSLERQLVFHMLPESSQHDWASACSSNDLLRRSSLSHSSHSTIALSGAPPTKSSPSLVSGENQNKCQPKEILSKRIRQMAFKMMNTFCVK